MAFPHSCSKAFWHSDSASGVALRNLAQLLHLGHLPLLVPPLQSSDSQACGENRKAQGPSPASIKSSLKLPWGGTPHCFHSGYEKPTVLALPLPLKSYVTAKSSASLDLVSPLKSRDNNTCPV